MVFAECGDGAEGSESSSCIGTNVAAGSPVRRSLSSAPDAPVPTCLRPGFDSDRGPASGFGGKRQAERECWKGDQAEAAAPSERVRRSLNKPDVRVAPSVWMVVGWSGD